MSTFRERPYVNGNFLVDLGTGDEEAVTAGFSEVILPAGAAEVIEYRNGNEKSNPPRKIPGFVRYENVILKRGITGALDLYEWWIQVQSGDPSAYRTVTIQLLSEDRSSTALAWKLTNAWPAAYRFSKLEARGEAVAMEIMELAYESMAIE